MGIPELAILLAGFALAHAAWSISDVPEGELLVPLAVIQAPNGSRQVERFEAPTQSEAIAAGKAAVAQLTGGPKAWAFAREGLMPDGDREGDVLSVDFWGPGMEAPVTILQRFHPTSSPSGFALIGRPEISINGRIQPDSAMAPLLDAVERGVMEHSKVAPLWAGWHKAP